MNGSPHRESSRSVRFPATEHTASEYTERVMAHGIAVSRDVFAPFDKRNGWKSAANWTAALLISAVFLLAGLWKITDPAGAAARLAQAKVPEALSIPAPVLLGTLETFTGILLLFPRFRR